MRYGAAQHADYYLQTCRMMFEETVLALISSSYGEQPSAFPSC